MRSVVGGGLRAMPAHPLRQLGEMRGVELFQFGDHRLLVGLGVVLAQFQLQLHLLDLEAEADDAAQLATVVVTLRLELPVLADAGFEAVADVGDQLGQFVGVV